MQIPMSGNTATFARAAVCAFASALVLSACASSGPSHKPARIEIQEQLGFTITEKTRISANVRLDFDTYAYRMPIAPQIGVDDQENVNLSEATAQIARE